ncbi:MAG: hypothetical protein VYA22_00245 [Pseudomonadota bacterium]|nr:hypothetical protein [Pseudomonadota bacterium]
MLVTIISLVFFGSVGYFVYNFSQCIAGILKLNTLLDSKVFGVLGVLAYVYWVYANLAILQEAIMRPIS